MAGGIIGSSLATVFRSGEMLFASKEVLDILKGWLKKHEEGLLERVFLERKFSELKEEIVSFILMQKLDAPARARVSRLLDFLSSQCKTEEIQAIQNVIFALVIFQTKGLPIGKQVSAPGTVGGAEVVKLDELKTAKAQEFLELLAQEIGETNTDQDFQGALKLLGRYRLIGQDPLWAIITELLGNAGKNLSKTLGQLPGKVTAFFRDEFPAEGDSGAIGAIAQRIRAGNERQRARLEQRRLKKGF